MASSGTGPKGAPLKGPVVFRSLFALTRPQFAAERVHLLEGIVFNGEEALRQLPFALIFRLQEHISCFTIYADALELPIELVTRQFQASLQGGFGRMVAAERHGRVHQPAKAASTSPLVGLTPSSTMAAFAARCAQLSSFSAAPPPASASPQSPSEKMTACSSATATTAATALTPSSEREEPEPVAGGKRSCMEELFGLDEAVQVTREVAARLQSAQALIAGARDVGISLGPVHPGVAHVPMPHVSHGGGVPFRRWEVPVRDTS